MAEQSFPIKERPMSGEQWGSVTRGIGSGVLDEGGAPYRLTSINNAQNTVTVAVDSEAGFAHAILGGFYHKIDSSMPLSIPAVTSPTTYWVALQFDPVRVREEQMPVQLGVFTALDRSQRKDYLILHRIVRQPNQLLTDAAFTKMDVKIAPTIIIDAPEALPNIDTVLWGTRVLITSTAEELRAGGSVGDRQWIPTIQRRFEWELKDDSGTYVSPPSSGGGYTRALGRRGSDRRLRGTVALVSGNDFQPGNLYNIMSAGIPEEDAPSAIQRFATTIGGVTTSGDARVARVEVAPDGSVYAWVSTRTAWISLDGCEWEAKP